MDDLEAAEFLELMAEKMAGDLAFEDALLEAAQALRENAKVTDVLLEAIAAGRSRGGVFEVPDALWRQLCKAAGLTPPG